MGKIRIAKLGDVQEEKELKKKAQARRAAKIEKKGKKKKEQEEYVTPSTSPAGEKVEPKGEVQEEKKEKPKATKAHQHSKRYKEVAKHVDKTKLYSLKEAVMLVKKTSTTKFEGTVEIHLNLSLQAINNKPEYRGSVNLPHGTGKKITVAIADETIIKKLETGTIDFDILVAHPSMMPKLAIFARILGPRGLMPNPKNGTVHQNPEERAKELSAGEVNFKTEPNNPIIHLGIGKTSFEETQIEENIQALINAVGKHRIAKATLSSTMGPGIKLDLATV